jgi:predicted RNA binding protein YcfA (HicA-like mRNA interferase family)
MVTSTDLLRALQRDGWEERRRSGSHAVLVHPEKTGRVVVPVHRGKTIKPGTLTNILRQAGLNREEFRSLL